MDEASPEARECFRMVRFGRTAAVVMSGCLAAASLAAAPSASAARPSPLSAVAPARAGELTVSFTLAQTVAQRAAIRSLAAHGTDTARAAKFAAASPDPAHRDAVVAWAAAHGFRVLHDSRYVVTVAGPAAALAAALGTGLKAAGSYTVPTASPVVPAELSAAAASVVGLSNRPVFRHHSAAYGPADVRAMSNSIVRDSTAGAGVTVGTVNFSGWVMSDLTSWAADPEADGDPAKRITIASNQITEWPISGFNTVDGSGNGGVEVALDAEAILGMAPAAKQRLYFAENSDAGSLALLDQMATDASQGRLQVVSTSWGGCELERDQAVPGSINAEETRLETLVAAGATVFAASGDAGAYDCTDSFHTQTTKSVDFPASSPVVVGVGGTTTQPGSTAFTYAHTAWGLPTATVDPVAGQGDGSGGGVSSHFSTQPTGQAAGPVAGRRVPDIAALADPSTGYIGRITTDWDGPGPNGPFADYTLLGGTSLAAPLSAAGLAVAIGHSPPVAGLGNILSTLYSHPNLTHDVVGNSNGYYTATSGYDQVTGLGVMDWTAFANIMATLTAPAAVRTTTVPVTVGGSAADFQSWGLVEGTPTGCGANNLTAKPTSITLADVEGSHTITLTALDSASVCHVASKTVVLDRVAPTVTGLRSTYVGTTSPRFTLTWAFADAGTSTGASSGLSSYDAIVRDTTAGTESTFTTVSGARLLGVKAGHAYTVWVRSHDKAGNVLGTSARNGTVVQFVAPTDDTSFRFSGFVRQPNPNDFGLSHAVGATAGSYTTFAFRGKTATVGMIKNVSSGYMDVYVDGVRTARINLFRSSTAFRQPVRVATFATAGLHTVVLRPIGVHQSGATGNNVYVDSLTIGQ